MAVQWTIPEDWPGETVFIVAGGTSVSYQGAHRLQGKRVIAVNSSYETVPFADILFFGDNRWYLEHYGRPAFKEFKGRKVTVSQPASGGPELFKLNRVTPPPGLCIDRRGLASQRTSLQGAMNLAVMLGAKRLILLGADAGRAKDNRSHHHKPHKWRNKPGDVTWDHQMQQLQLIVAPLAEMGIEVVNTSPVSRLPYWPIIPLERFLR